MMVFFRYRSFGFICVATAFLVRLGQMLCIVRACLRRVSHEDDV